jgi:membrane-associated protease RseP (regulator of RpoE activity)
MNLNPDNRQPEWQTGYYDRYPQREYKPRRSLLQKLFAKERRTLHLVLFVLTIASTYIAVQSLLYSFAIMSILLSHEMGHYVMCRRHKIPATLPYFIPMPFSPFGTWGAVIAMRQTIPNRRALFDVGVAGPLAGLILAIPAIVIGLHHSTIINPDTLGEGSISMGEPLVFQFIRYLVLGPLPDGKDVLIHPLAYAGWVGLFVTALNLLPVGQLDGGHIAYALFGEKSKYVFIVAIGIFAVSAFYFPGWILMLILLVFFFFKHPPPVDNVTMLDNRRKALGIFMFVVFIVSFTPVPFYI